MNLFGQPINWWSTGAYGLLCALAGYLAARRQGRRAALAGPAPSVKSRLDEQTVDNVNAAAHEWADRTGRTGAHANVASSYVQLAMRLQRPHSRFDSQE